MNNSSFIDKKQKLSEYIQLIESFLVNRMEVVTFERQYLEKFKNDPIRWQGQEYAALNDLFLDVDAFCADETLADEGDLDESELRARAETAMQKLKSL